jgi:hypothetical protein
LVKRLFPCDLALHEHIIAYEQDVTKVHNGLFEEEEPKISNSEDAFDLEDSFMNDERNSITFAMKMSQFLKEQRTPKVFRVSPVSPILSEVTFSYKDNLVYKNLPGFDSSAFLWLAKTDSLEASDVYHHYDHHLNVKFVIVPFFWGKPLKLSTTKRHPDEYRFAQDNVDYYQWKVYIKMMNNNDMPLRYMQA